MYNVGILTSLNDPLICYFIKETYKLNNTNTNIKIKIFKQEEYKAKYYKVIKNNYLSIVKKKIKDKKYKFNKINLIK
tara:strand:- start:549 stop:779 length:231 start_codon:yes stop_codon:yes gene_type:complete